MEKCSVCKRTENEVRLFDGVYVNDMSKICERCALTAGIPLIKRPSVNQLRDSEKPYAVRERLMMMNRLKQETKKEKPLAEQLKELEEKPELEQPSDDELVYNLVDNFHWVLQTARRRRGLTLKQLAEAVKESESALAMLEKKIVPRGSLPLLAALEQLLGVKLIKKDLAEIEAEIKRKEELRKFEMEKRNYVQHKTEPTKESDELVELKPEISQENLNFRKRIAEKASVWNLQKQNEKIERDFEYPNKTREQVGEEQLDRFGKEDVDRLKKNIIKQEQKKNRAPSIYELMKQKEERDKNSVTGKDIQVVEGPKEFDM